MDDETTTTTTDQPDAEDKALAEAFLEIAADPAAELEREIEKPVPETPPAASIPLDALSNEQLTALRGRLGIDSINQGLRNLAGTVGGINTVLQELRAISKERAGTPEAAAAAKVERAMLKELDESGYDSLADALLPGLQRILGAAAPPAATADDGLRQTVETQGAHIESLEKRLLEHDHPNWEQEIAAKGPDGKPITDADGKYEPSPEFLAWFKTKSAEQRDEFRSTNRSDVLGGYLDDFKAFRSATQSPAPGPAPSPAPSPARTGGPVAADAKRIRLAAAVVPKGAPGAPVDPKLTEDEEMAAGYRSVRRASG